MKTTLLFILILLSVAFSSSSSVEQEITSFYKHLELWYTAQIPNNPNTFARFKVLQDNYLLVPSSATSDPQNVKQVLASIQNNYGSQTKGQYSISIRNINVRNTGKTVVVLYEQEINTRGNIVKKLTTGVFEQKAPTPNGFVWIHTHESFKI